MGKKKLDWFDNVESRAHPRPGLNWLTTTLSVNDVCKAIDFYTGAMDMVAIAEMEDEQGVMVFARIRYRGNNFVLNKEQWDFDALSPATSQQPPPFAFYLYVDDVSAVIASMKDAGATILAEPTRQFWGDLRARVKDPFGYYWDIAQKL